jgi:hypothetical protein
MPMANAPREPAAAGTLVRPIKRALPRISGQSGNSMRVSWLIGQARAI